MSSSNSSEAHAALHAERSKLNKGLDSQMDQDPYSENAVQATVSYTPEMANNGYGSPFYSYWY